MKTNAVRLSRSLLVLILLAAASATTLAADLSGTWSVDGEVYGNAVRYPLRLKQEGGKLTGTARFQDKDRPVTGTIKDTAVTWTFETEYNGAPLQIEFTGTLTMENDINVTISDAGVQCEMTCKRQ